MSSFNVGDIIRTKKPHVCGSEEWEIISLGADVKLKCVKCGREIALYRYELTKRLSKKTIK